MRNSRGNTRNSGSGGSSRSKGAAAPIGQYIPTAEQANRTAIATVLARDVTSTTAANISSGTIDGQGTSTGRPPSTFHSLNIMLSLQPNGTAEITLLRNGRPVASETQNVDNNLFLRIETTVKNQLTQICNALNAEKRGR